MKFNFDEIIERKNSGCVKYDQAKEVFGTDDLLPMWVADMDFKTPDCILDAIKRRAEHPVLGYFYHSDGFYRSIIDWMYRRHQWAIEKEWIQFSPGIVSGLALIVEAFTRKNDKIIVQPPVYHPFYYVVENQERQIVKNPLRMEGDLYKMDYFDLEEKLKAGAKMLILCNPHNPVGRSWTRGELQRLGELCIRYNCLILSDEIHADLVLTGSKHTPMAHVSKEIADHTITCMAPSKTFNMAGMTTSEVIIPNADLRKQYERYLIERLHLQGGNIFGDVALEAAYTHGEEWLDELLLYITSNVKYCQNFIAERIRGIKTYKQEATYLLWMDFHGTGMTHEQLWQKLVYEAKLGLNDGAIFGEGGTCFMRMNLACPKSTVEEAMQRLERVFNE